MLPAHEVVLVALEVDHLLRPVVGRIEHVGAGTGLVGGKPGGAPVAVLLVLPKHVRIGDGHNRHGGEERCIRLVQDEAHGPIIHRGHIVRIEDRLEGAGRRLTHAEQALEAVDDVLGRDRAAIVEGRALA